MTVAKCCECRIEVRSVFRRGLCSQCYKRHWRAGTLDNSPALPRQRREALPIGYREVDQWGYVIVKTGTGQKGWTREHRLVMERLLGRPLRRGESVHHKNGIKTDNRPGNLELWFSAQQPKGQRVDDLIEYVVAHHRENVLAALK